MRNRASLAGTPPAAHGARSARRTAIGRLGDVWPLDKGSALGERP